jgi:hypothetical protein
MMILIAVTLRKLNARASGANRMPYKELNEINKLK